MIGNPDKPFKTFVSPTVTNESTTHRETGIKYSPANKMRKTPIGATPPLVPTESV